MRLPRFHGAGRQLDLMATIFPSSSAARHALAHDAAPRGCHAPPRSALPAGARACTFGGAGARIAGMYVFATAGNVEYLVVGDVFAGSATALTRAVRDATSLAAHEAEHLRHVLALAHGCLVPAAGAGLPRGEPGPQGAPGRTARGHGCCGRCARQRRQRHAA